MSATFDSGVSAVLAAQVSDFEELQCCERLTSGASQETYRLVVRAAGAERRYALRRSALADSTGGAMGAINLEAEAKLLRVMTAAGIPGPEVYYVLQPQDGLGSGFLMQWLDGVTIGSHIVRGAELAELRPRLARECGEVLARIHAVDWRSAQLEQVLTRLTPEQLVHESWDFYRDMAVAEPMIDYSARWLLEHLPEQPGVSVVHGDFRNGNLMVTPAGITAVLDWEVAHLGDPVRDLGWLCVNSWRFGNSELPVGGFGQVADLLQGYNAVSRLQVTPQQLHYWQVFGSFWWSVVCLRMAHSWRNGDNLSVERPAIGRRSSEAQMDCVNLLMPGEFELPTVDAAQGGAWQLSKQQQLPLVDELLDSVQQYLAQDVAAAADAQGKFMARVAANSVAIARRELMLGPELQRAEAARLQALLGGAAVEVTGLRSRLVSALRDGMALDTPGLSAHLRQTVAGQLAIDQPGYGALRTTP